MCLSKMCRLSKLPKTLVTRRPHKVMVICNANLQALLANPICDPEVTHVIWLAKDLIPEVLALFPNTLYIEIKGLRLTSLAALMLNGKPVMPYLIYIDCSENLITSLEGIHLYRWLMELNCCFNQLPTLKYLQGCVRLVELYCDGNAITDFTAILYLPKLRDLIHDGDGQVTDSQPPPVRALMQMLTTGETEPILMSTHRPDRSMRSRLFFNEEPVHRPDYGMWDQTFIETTHKAILKLLQDPVPAASSSNSEASKIVKSVLFGHEHVPKADAVNKQYRLTLAQLVDHVCKVKTVHKRYHITFAQLVDYVLQRIMSSSKSANLLTQQPRVPEALYHPVFSRQAPSSLLTYFKRHMRYAPYLSINQLFRYTILFLSRHFEDTPVTYTPETRMDRVVTALEAENEEAGVDQVCLRVFTAMANQNYGYESALSTVCAITARAETRIEATPFDEPIDEPIDWDSNDMDELDDTDYDPIDALNLPVQDFTLEFYDSIAASRPARLAAFRALA